MLDFWTDPKSSVSTLPAEYRKVCDANLSVFYQTFDMIMMLSTEDITTVRELIIKDFLDKDKYLEKKRELDYEELR